SPPVLADTVGTIGRIARQALHGLEVCLFFLHHAESDALAMMGGDWDPELPIEPKSFTVGTSEKLPLAQVFRESQPAHLEAGTVSTGWEQDELLRHLGLEAIFYLPLSVEHRTIGVMAVGTRNPAGLSAEHRRLATLIAEHVAVMIERSRLYE